MSVRITVHCDRAHGPAVCPVRIYTNAATVEEARAAATREGWAIGSRDYCPTHSGRTRPAPTVRPFPNRPTS